MGWALSERLAGPEQLRGPFERVTWAGLFGLGSWTAACWLLALAHQLSRAGVGMTGLAALVVGLGLIFREKHAGARALSLTRTATLVWGLLGLALLLFTVLVLWRGAVMPVSNNDALAYHLPKAVVLVQEHGYRLFVSPDARLSTWPANYELLLSSILLLDGGDSHVAWLGTVCFFLFLAAAGAVAERTWGRGLHVAAGVALAAGMPVALLHAGAVKNDLLTNFLFLAALLAAAEWAVRPSRFAGVSVGLALCIALGTKLNAVFLVAAVAPLLVIGAWRALRQGGSRLALVASLALFPPVFLLEGGVVYGVNAVALHRLVGVPVVHAGAYGDFRNLYLFPYLLFKAPFSDSNGVWAFWTHSEWFWQKYDLFSSHLGIAVTVALLLLPFGLREVRQVHGEGVRELKYITAAAVGVFLLLLPTRILPAGFFCTFTRFVLFLGPVVAVWTVVPVVRRLWTGPRNARGGAVALLGLLQLNFCAEAVASVRHDLLVPLERVSACFAHAECAPRYSKGRACFALDKVAGPQDVIAVDSDYDSWLYPCFGPARTRSLRFLRGLNGERLRLPDDATWVVVDRMRGITWGNPGFLDFGHFFEFIGKGSPTTDELYTFNAMAADPRFTPVFRNAQKNQAVFRRISQGAGGSRVR